VEIGTDSQTWLALREGRLSGLDAFSQRRLWARGNLDLAVCFEGLFHLSGGRAPLVRIHDVAAGDQRISTLTAGTGPEHVILIHGLGGNKTSFFETVSALAPSYTTHAIDLPGFGSSSKPARAPYDAPWFAESVLEFMNELDIDRAHLVGNSMGGRVALELGLAAPHRFRSLGLLNPALAFRRKRELVPLVKLLRPELAAIPHPLRHNLVRDHFWSMFGHPERLDPTVADIACDEFIRHYRTRSARVAFYAAARNIYLDAPFGDDGFWTRLAELEPPTLFIWGGKDILVPAKFSRHVEECLPSARQVTFEDCGHVPQVELPERTNEHLLELFADASRTEHGRLRRLARIA
jgi:pimeloyl-ACP methyl ester carboxylesterase